MFQQILNPPRRALPERGMTLMLTLALVFVCVSIWAFARAARVPETQAQIDAPRGTIECTTEDGTIVIVGEIVSIASLPRR